MWVIESKFICFYNIVCIDAMVASEEETQAYDQQYEFSEIAASGIMANSKQRVSFLQFYRQKLVK